MSNNNKTVAEQIINQLKEKELISAGETNIENQIANGTIKESDWKVIFEQQIKNKQNKDTNEVK